MSDRVEWIDAAGGEVTLLTGAQTAVDGQYLDPGNIGLELPGAVIEGTPGELLELLSTAINKVSAHLAGQS